MLSNVQLLCKVGWAPEKLSNLTPTCQSYILYLPRLLAQTLLLPWSHSLLLCPQPAQKETRL